MKIFVRRLPLAQTLSRDKVVGRFAVMLQVDPSPFGLWTYPHAELALFSSCEQGAINSIAWDSERRFVFAAARPVVGRR